MKSITVYLRGGRRKTLHPLGGKLTVRTRLTCKQKKCAAKFISEEMHEWKKGGWPTRKQAIAVGYSRARKAC